MGNCRTSSLVTAVNYFFPLVSAAGYLRVIVYRKCFFKKPLSSDLLMLDGMAGISFKTYNCIADLYDFGFDNSDNKFSRDAFIDSISYLYTNRQEFISAINNRQNENKPLVFFTLIYCQENDVENIQNYLANTSEKGDFQLLYFNSLDSAAIGIIIYSYSYTPVLSYLNDLLSSFPGCINSTHVGCRIKKIHNWVEEKNELYLNISQKCISRLKEIERKNGISSYIQTGTSDRSYYFESLSGQQICQKIQLFLNNNAVFHVTPQLLKLNNEEDNIWDYVNRLNQSNFLLTTQELNNLLKDWDEFIRTYKMKLKNFQAENIISAKLFLNMLERIKNIFIKIESSFFYDPIFKMLSNFYKGFLDVLKEQININPQECFRCTSELLLKIIHIIDSTPYGLSIHSQTPGNSDKFRAVSTRLLYAYYYIVMEIDYCLRSYDEGGNCLEARKVYYMLAPEFSPDLHMQTLFAASVPSSHRLFIAEFPQHLLFNPKAFLPSIIHEIAHKAGDKLRMRQQRADVFFRIISDIISDYLIACSAIPIIANKCEINKYFFNYFRTALLNETNKEKNYLREFVFILDYYFHRMVSPHALRELAALLALSKEEANYLAYNFQCTVSQILLPRISSFIHELADICSEVYADIVCIKILNLNAEDYFYMLANNYGLGWATSTQLTKAPLFCRRLEIVMEIAGIGDYLDNNTLDSSVKIIKKIYNAYAKDTNQHFPGNSKKYLVQFFQLIWIELENDNFLSNFDSIRECFAKLRTHAN